MNSDELYRFDLDGYLAVPGLLDAGEIAALDALFSERIAAQMKPETLTQRLGGMLDWGRPYRDLIDHARIRPYLEAMLGAKYRLDHVYADVIRAGVSPIGASLHGGATPYSADSYFHFRDGRMHNGLVVVAINLRDVGPGDGGFGCVPGSHKANYPFPPAWRDLTQRRDCVRAVTGPAGTAVMFTEALTHSALPWTAAHERRTVFFKYAPHPLAWASHFYDAAKWPDLNERERAILESPNARYENR